MCPDRRPPTSLVCADRERRKPNEFTGSSWSLVFSIFFPFLSSFSVSSLFLALLFFLIVIPSHSLLSTGYSFLYIASFLYFSPEGSPTVFSVVCSLLSPLSSLLFFPVFVFLLCFLFISFFNFAFFIFYFFFLFFPFI